MKIRKITCEIYLKGCEMKSLEIKDKFLQSL